MGKFVQHQEYIYFNLGSLGSLTLEESAKLVILFLSLNELNISNLTTRTAA
jgi:hypothetical protein